MSFLDERGWILAHCSREAFHDDHFRLDSGEPLGDRPHRGTIWVKSMPDTDEHQALRSVLIARDKWNEQSTVAWAPGLRPSLQIQ